MNDVARRGADAVVGTAKLTGGIAVGALETVEKAVEGTVGVAWEGLNTVNDAAGTVLNAGLSPLGIDAFQGHADRNAARGQAIVDGVASLPELPGKIAQSAQQAWDGFEQNWDAGNHYDVGRQMSRVGVNAAAIAVPARGLATLRGAAGEAAQSGKASGLGIASEFKVPASAGARATPISVRGGGVLAEGSTVSNIETIARGRGIREVDRLVETYGGQAQNWRKLKGTGMVETPGAGTRAAELHWYQNDAVGKVEFKVKEWLD